MTSQLLWLLAQGWNKLDKLLSSSNKLPITRYTIKPRVNFYQPRVEIVRQEKVRTVQLEGTPTLEVELHVVLIGQQSP